MIKVVDSKRMTPAIRRNADESESENGHAAGLAHDSGDAVGRARQAAATEFISHAGTAVAAGMAMCVDVPHGVEKAAVMFGPGTGRTLTSGMIAAA